MAEIIFWSSLSFSRVDYSFTTPARLLTLSWAFSDSLRESQNHSYSFCESLPKSFEARKSVKTTIITKINH